MILAAGAFFLSLENPKHTAQEPELLTTYLDDAHKKKFEELRTTSMGMMGFFDFAKHDETCVLTYATGSTSNKEEMRCEHLNEGIDRAYTVLIENNLALIYGYLDPASLRTIEKMREGGASVTMRKVGPDTCSLVVKSEPHHINSTLEQDCKLLDGVINDFAKTMGVEHG